MAASLKALNAQARQQEAPSPVTQPPALTLSCSLTLMPNDVALRRSRGPPWLAAR